MITIIEQLRKEHGYSQDELAKLINVSRPSFSEIEKGEKDLTVSQAEKLADFLSISFTDFIANRVPPAPVLVVKKEKTKTNKMSSMRISVPEKNMKKFKEVLLYVLGRIGAKPNIGESVLCKLMYFIDFDFYERYEKQLMGAVYIKNHHGPTPAAFTRIIAEMEEKEEITPAIRQRYKYQQKKYLPLRNPDLSLITAEEQKHIDWVLARLSDKNAKEMEEYSHRDVPWITAEEQSVIDYEAVFYRTPDFSVRSYD
ncbi:MAG: type II toxin-antitoxin system antitoxin SocA domain-containing protein [Patescibacteria group bacterium]